MKVLRGMMKERMAEPERPCEDFFDHVIQELRREKPLLTETIALDLMFVLLFASFETTALALTIGVKLLTENPKVVDALRVSLLSTLAVDHISLNGSVMSSTSSSLIRSIDRQVKAK